MGARPSCKTERHCVANSRAFLKKYFLRHLIPFHGDVREWYSGRFIEHHDLYA